MSTQKISLFLAILININIVVGGAFFLGAPLIAASCGSMAPFAWLIVGMLLLPLILVLAHLSKQYPVAGGLYVYSEKQLGSLWGFIAGWGYYIGTVAGNAFILHGFARQAEQLGITFGITGFTLDLALITVFCFINFFNIELLGIMQMIFTSLKTIPLFLAVIGAMFFFNINNFSMARPEHLSGIITSIPLVFFAYLGLEACCAIGHIIKDGKKNAARAIMISFIAIISLYTFVQFCLIAIHGTTVSNPFTAIVPLFLHNKAAATVGIKVVELALLSSYLGGFYSMFYTNNWNLHTIATARQLPFSSLLIRINKFSSPIVCIVLQGILLAGFLCFTRNLTTLTTMSDFGIVIAYLLSTISFLVLIRSKQMSQVLLGILSAASCSYLLYICFHELLKNGIGYVLPYVGLLVFGLFCYGFMMLQRRRTN